jgi:4-amino-4-deoxy-L-arabinose transferase-like glycosyltransferase
VYPSTPSINQQIIEEPQRTAKQPPYAFLAMLCVSAAAFFFGLGGLGMLGPDEPRYAEIAREMFASGDYISTRLCGCLWFEKPPLLYWMSAASYHLFGVNELTARLPSAATALATVGILYATLRRMHLQGLAVSSSVVLATSGLFIAYARVAVTDMVLTAAVTAALLAASLATNSISRRRSLYWTLSFFSMGVAVLAKGIVGLVLVAGILFVYLLLSGQLKTLRTRDCLLGLLIFLAVTATWYLPVTLRHGWLFVDEFFVRHHFQRYTSNEFGHPQPVFFFLIVALAGLVPWTFMLLPAVARLRSVRPRIGPLRALASLRGRPAGEDRQEGLTSCALKSRDSLLLLCWIWVALPLLFFSFSESKLPGYILPIFPAMAVIIGVEVERTLLGNSAGILRAAQWLTAITLLGLGVAFIGFTHHESVDVSGWRALLVGAPLAIALVSTVFLAAKRNHLFIASATGTVISTILAGVILLFPVLGEEVSLKSLSLDAAAALRPGEKITFYIKKEFAAVFYAEGRVLCEPNQGPSNALSEDILASALDSEPSLVVITNSNWLEGLERDPRFTLEFIAAQGEALALRVSLKPLPD